MIRANFKISKSNKSDEKQTSLRIVDEKRDLTKSEFEEYMIKAGAAGSFMVFRSDKKEDELGLDEL